MKALALAVLTFFTLSCSGFAKPVSKPAWPGHYSDQLLYWCIPEGDGMWDVYVDVPVECPAARVSRGQWDHLPLTIAAEDTLEKETKEAVEYMNLHLGFEMFQYTEDIPSADIEVLTYGDHWYAAAMAKRFTYEGRHFGAVLVYNGYEAKDHTQMMVHELGHLLGLKHDAEEKWSIMYPSVSNRPTSLEPRDIALLRSLYRPLLRRK